MKEDALRSAVGVPKPLGDNDVSARVDPQHDGKEVAAFTVNTFEGLPLSLRLAEQVFAPLNANKTVVLHQCQLKDFRLGTEAVVSKPLRVFPDFASFIEQSIVFKLQKYALMLQRLLAFCIRTSHPIVYSTESITATLALLVKKALFYKNIAVIYHQFEMDLLEQKSASARVLFAVFRRLCGALDLFIVPEQNRLDYFREQVRPIAVRSIVIPNTTESKGAASCARHADKVVFGHVGALGTNHYAANLLGALRGLDFDWELLLIGRVSPEVREMIDRLKLDRVRVVDHMPHAKLQAYYRQMDFGLILYRAVNLNSQFCAPNKLYEMWAHGIPVIGPPLAGLRPLFSEPFLGRIVDMENPDAIASGIRECVHDRHRFASGAIARYFEENFRLERYVTELRTTLSNL